MTTPLAFQAMEALLRQGRVIAAMSWLLAGGAVAWLVVATLACAQVPPGAYAAAALVLVAGVAQAWQAMRVGFDADLLRALAPHAGVEDTAALVDATLAELGLATPRGATRGWPERWRGARRLLHRQALCAAIQFAAFAAMLFLGDAAACLAR